ncbi:acyl carrier protein [Paenibacillus sp. FSL W7-1287]|uniref:acyl carrier protein n=1 Tax=Paenibacillus sp. FSL W7-1287 TaxID=2954538 RepID=UPI0030FC0F90
MNLNIRDKVEDIIHSCGMEVTEDLSEQLDSMSFVTIIVEIEQSFGIEVPDDKLDFIALSTVSAMVDMVRELSQDLVFDTKGGENHEKIG